MGTRTAGQGDAWTGDAVHPTSTADELARLLPQSELHVASDATDLESWSGLMADFVERISNSDPGRVDGDSHT